MEQTTEQVIVERELEIAASPERVRSFLVDAELAVRWMGVSALVAADSLDDAVAKAGGCPILENGGGVEVYETIEM
jgi:uncharacterized protein YndB with AHSA1/START domain